MTIPYPATLFDAFVAGPEALGVVGGASLVDPAALEDLYTAHLLVEGSLLVGKVPFGGSVEEIQERAQTLNDLLSGVQGGRADPQLVRQSLQTLSAAFHNCWTERAIAKAVGRLQRASLLFATPAAAREAARGMLVVGQRPSAISERIYDNVLELITRRNRAGAQVPEALYRYALDLSGYPPDTPHPISVLIFHLGRGQDDVSTLHYLSLLVTHSPELFDETHVRAMKKEASRLRRIHTTTNRTDPAYLADLLNTANRLHAFAQQLGAGR